MISELKDYIGYILTAVTSAGFGSVITEHMRSKRENKKEQHLSDAQIRTELWKRMEALEDRVNELSKENQRLAAENAVMKEQLAYFTGAKVVHVVPS